MKKALIFDTSSIISLALNNLLDILPKLKKELKVEFFITPQVKREAIDVPMKIKRFELEALMIEDLVTHGTLTLLDTRELESETRKVIRMANSAFSTLGKDLKLLHNGEASCFALQKILPNYQTALVIDERTARLIAEKPGNLRRLMEFKLKKPVKLNKSSLDYFKDTQIMRSTELTLIAYKKNMIHIHAPAVKAVDALLFALKFKGCSISRDEIRDAKNLFS